MAFFDWDRIFSEFEEYENVDMWMVLAPRNVGKSTSTYKYLINNKYFTKDKKVLILRNTENQQKEMIKDFNNRFKDKLLASGSFIYELIPEAHINTKTKEVEHKFKKGEVVGYIASINTYTNMKSVEAKDVKFIFYEEFNEDTIFGKNIYVKFINLITTFQRFSNVKFVLLGNKDSFNNDYFVNWDIQPNDNNQEDKITEIKSYDGEEILGVCLDLGLKRFADLGNENTLSNKLAQLDGRSRSYANGGYAKEIISNVRNVRSFINDFKPSYKIAIQDANYVFGKVNNMYAIVSPWNWEYDDNLKVYALDKISRTNAISLTKEEMENVARLLMSLFKENKIIFDSWDTRALIQAATTLLQIQKN